VPQVFVQLIELFFFLGKPVFKHFQFYHEILALIQFKSCHFKVIATTKTTPHKVLMILPITDPCLIEFTLQSKPFMPVQQNQYSKEMDGLANNQDDCDYYFEFN